MFAAPNIIAGLEIGTSKICVVVGEQDTAGALKIIGVGQSLSRGVRKGEIINPTQVGEDLREALSGAEKMADVEISSVFLGVSGGHVQSFNNRGFHRVVPAGREIFQEDVEDVVNNAKAVSLPVEHSLIHTIRQHFLVDGQDGVTDPVGMHGSRLELDLHTIHGNANRLQTPVSLVRSMSLKVDGVVFNGIASSLALLSQEQKELGALVIDIGGGTTEFVVYSEGIIRHSGVLAVGGDHISNDLGYGLKVSLKQAEKLKLEHGSALITDVSNTQTVSVTDENGFPCRLPWL
jgi:cell division protein FtsA